MLEHRAGPNIEAGAERPHLAERWASRRLRASSTGLRLVDDHHRAGLADQSTGGPAAVSRRLVESLGVPLVPARLLSRP
jgi:hypothetical protein